MKYIDYEARFLAILIKDINDDQNSHLLNCVQQYYFDKKLKVFEENKGKEVILTEVQQQHTRKCFTHIALYSLTKQERKKVEKALFYLEEKWSGDIKSFMIYI